MTSVLIPRPGISQLPRTIGESNANVRLILVFSIMWWIARTLWENTLSVLIFLLENREKEYVGFAASVEGVSQLLVAIPAGIMADRWRRDSVLKLASVIGFISIGVTIFAVHTQSLGMIYFAMAIWGAAYALNESPMESMFADSTTTGKRGRVFAIKFALNQTGRGAGAIIVALLFAHYGDVWDISECKKIVTIGLLLTLIPTLLQAGLNDDISLLAASEATAVMSPSLSIGLLPREAAAEHKLLTRIPILLASTDIITSLGAGATVKFFPLYFIDRFDQSPVHVGILFAITPFACSISSLIAERIASRVGRTTTIIVYHITGAFLLYWFVACSSIVMAAPIYLLRTAIMNSIKPLKRSILMDVVPKTNRGKWNAIESISVMGWTGSAALGGYVVDQWGYEVCFNSTATLYLFSITPVLLMAYYNVDQFLDRAKCDID